MAMNDWNGNGEDDAFDSYIDYELTNDTFDSDSGSDYSGGYTGGHAAQGNNTVGGIISAILGFVMMVLIFYNVDVEDVPTIAIIAVWLICTVIVAEIIRAIRRHR